MDKIIKIYYAWLLGGFTLNMVGVAIFNFASQGLGLAFVLVGTAEFLIPYVAYAQYLLRKRVKEYFKNKSVICPKSQECEESRNDGKDLCHSEWNECIHYKYLEEKIE